MQTKSESFGEFSARTDRLAAHLRVNLSELTDVIHLSNGMLFAYRKGKHPISTKAWSKLEAAELKAGIQAQPPPRQSLAEMREKIPPAALAILDQASLALAHYLAAERALMLCVKARPVFEDEETAKEFREWLRIYTAQHERGSAAIEAAVKSLERNSELEMYRHYMNTLGPAASPEAAAELDELTRQAEANLAARKQSRRHDSGDAAQASL
ncbi:MAG TPA: hypothetical protein VK985_09485 [Rariglobus sp.]|nr:hypothetical protein [Rariglobus sp.]